MQSEQHLNDAEVSELLAGHRMEEGARHLALCGACSAQVEELAGLRDALRADLNERADHPEHFWVRQRARVRERLAVQRTPLRWPVAAMAALAALSVALLSIKAPTPAARPAQSADADDQLLKDIQHSLAHRAPEPLMPASVLVQEMTTDPRNDEKREN